MFEVNNDDIRTTNTLARIIQSTYKFCFLSPEFEYAFANWDQTKQDSEFID